jgi:hypothetical protein
MDKLHRKYQTELSKMGAERADLNRKAKADAAQLEQYKTEAESKHQQQRRALNRQRIKLAQHELPNREERAEIEQLKDALAKCQIDSAEKVRKGKLNADRLGAKVKDLNAENKELRDQIALLEQERLQKWESVTDFGQPAEQTTQHSSAARANSAIARANAARVKSTRGRAARTATAKVNSNNTQSAVHSKKGGQIRAALGSIGNGQPSIAGVQETVQANVQPNVQAKARAGAGAEAPVAMINEGVGSVRFASSDASMIHYPNGDWKRAAVSAEGAVSEYYYAHVQTLHTTFPDGVQIFKFPDGTLERHSPSGHKSIVQPGVR